MLVCICGFDYEQEFWPIWVVVRPTFTPIHHLEG